MTEPVLFHKLQTRQRRFPCFFDSIVAVHDGKTKIIPIPHAVKNHPSWKKKFLS